MTKILTFALFLLIWATTPLAAQVPGCTDPRANNFNPDANVNDGSCTYNPTIYNPSFLYFLPGEVEETSGLVYEGGYLWTINDSGNAPVLYKLDTIDGSMVQKVTVGDASNIDWEALAQDEDYLYIGDFGNNSGARDDLGIYKVSKADLPDSGNGTVNSEYISFIYPDFSQPETRQLNNFDCEAMVSIGDSLYLFSKNWGDSKTRMYRLPKTPGDYTADFLTTYDVAGLVTGADYNESAKEVTLVGYTNGNFVPFLWLLFDYDDNQVFSGNKRRIDMIGATATQTEAISYVIGKNGTISSEGSVLFTQSAYSFYTGTWTNDSPTGIGKDDSKGFDFTLLPNPVKSSKLVVNIGKLVPGDYQIEVYDSSGKLMQIKEYRLETEKSEVRVSLNVEHLRAGIYFVRMRSVQTIVEKKFIKQ